jgi:hypothetical protein
VGPESVELLGSVAAFSADRGAVSQDGADFRAFIATFFD